MVFRLAEEKEFEKVRSLYWEIIDWMEDAEYKPGWIKGVYPADDYLQAALASRTLYVLDSGPALAAAMILNHACTDGYENVPWGTEAAEEEITVIHALGVLPSRQGQGLAKRLVAEAVRTAGEQGQKAIRLDVLGSNLSAQRLYTKMGFQYRGTVPLYYEDTGRTDFLMYEYII